MSFREIKPFRFRNLREDAVQVFSPEVFFIGENGQGKSNFLEAIYYLCYASSFRVHKDSILVTHGYKDMSVQGVFTDEDENSHHLISKFEDRKKKVILDKKTVRDRKELIYQLPCIVFTHDDMALIKGNPEERRRFFNQTAGLYDPLSIDEYRLYSKVLHMRNEAIKHREMKLLDVLNLQLVSAGIPLQERRTALVEEFNDTFTPLFRQISGLSDSLKIEYLPSWQLGDSEQTVINALESSLQRDMVMKTTTSGPHRDRFIFRMGKRDFGAVASTGQIRLISLILKIAQSIYYSQKTGKKAIYLIDDVLLELDLPKRKSVLALLPPYRQAFFTFLPDEPYGEYAKSDTLLLSVKNGAVVPI